MSLVPCDILIDEPFVVANETFLVTKKKDKLKTKTYTLHLSLHNKNIIFDNYLINSCFLNILEANLMATDNRKWPSDFDGSLRYLIE